MKRLLPILFIFAMIVFGLAIPHLRESKPTERHLLLFQTTDLHGNVGNSRKPGILQIAAEIRRERAKNPESLWIDCGDLTLGTLSATYDRGFSMISALSAAGCDVFVPGNHDFEYGREILIRNLKAFRGTVLGANLKVEGFEDIKPWALMECGSIRVAVIGIVPPYLRLWIDENRLQGIETYPAEESIDRHMPAVMAAKPDMIVLAIHLGEYTGKRLTGTDKAFSLATLASKYPQIDLILCGHTHQTEPGKRLYSGTWLVQAPALGKDAVRIDAHLKNNGYNTEIDSISSNLLGIELQSARDPELQTLFDPLLKWEKEFTATKIAKIDFDLLPMVSSKTPCKLAEELCHAMCEASGADAAFSSSISNYKKLSGDLTEGNLFSLIPYENRVVSRELTPAQIRTIVKELNAKHAKLGTWMTRTGFTISSGRDGVLLSSKTGKAIPEDARISVAFNSYAASGAGGRYPELAKIIKDAPVFREELPDLRDVFRSYLKKHYPYHP